MTDQPNTPAAAPAPSSAPMLITMLLLTVAFALTGGMLLRHAARRSGGTLPALAAKLAPPPPGEWAAAHAPADTPAPAEKAGGPNPFGKRGGEVRWPKLELTGFGSASQGGEDFAIINGELAHPGQLIGGKVKLVRVGSYDVEVEYRGATKTLVVETGE